MSHTGIRLKITIGNDAILDADSDWLHMNAIMAGALHMPDTMAELMSEQAPPQYDWVEIGQLHAPGVVPIQIWVQPANLPDDYPDDEAAGVDCCDNYISETDANCELPAGHDGPHYSAIEWGP
jgi:hypothetical protein